MNIETFTFQGVLSRLLSLIYAFVGFAFVSMILSEFGVMVTPTLFYSLLLILAVIVVAWAATAGVRTMFLNRQIAARPVLISDLVAQFPDTTYEPMSTDIKLPDTFEELNKNSWRLKNTLQSKDWQYTDYSYDIYKRTRYGKYKSSTIHYSVLSINLPRSLPRMVFDAPKAHGSQYRFRFHKATRHNLEGNFDTYFTTYFPKHYSIDALSIISPEVMQAMINAHECDIEISGNRLYLYGRLSSIENIPGLIEKGLLIKQKLMNNIITYRDERIDIKRGRQETSSFGTYLQANPYRYWSLLAIGIALTVAALILARNGGGVDELLHYGIALIIVAVYDFVTVSLNNKRLDEQYVAVRGFERTASSNLVQNRGKKL